MANNYQESSSLLTIPEDKIGRAQAIIDQVIKELNEDEDGNGCGCSAELEKTGVWFCGDESIDIESVEAIAKELLEQLEIDEPFYCSWSYTCSKPRLDEFGGGAMVVRRGHDTYYVDAMIHVQEYVRKEKEEVTDV